MQRIKTPYFGANDIVNRETQRIAQRLRWNPFAERRVVIAYGFGDVDWGEPTPENEEVYYQQSVEIPKRRRVHRIRHTPFMCTDHDELCEMIEADDGSVIIRTISPWRLDPETLETLAYHITAR